ncbi:MAG: non-ribosomal peptide synthetase [Streptomycetaceae bacterium]|nr:non-ribosomal peptide synthetase [Streptomycetaceae bacterium]
MTSTTDQDRPPATLVELFGRTAARYPDRPAAADDRQALSYAQLGARSDALAARLRDSGVGREDRVGLYADRSVDVFVSILGILKAGAAYVAVDTRYPDARRDLMLRESGASVVVTQPGWEDRLPGLAADVLAWRSGPGDDAARPVAPVAEPDAAASVLFTSGSFGAPKAVVLEHRNIVSFACNSALPRLGPGDRTGQISSISFDAFHFEMWSTLAQGAEIAVLPPVPELLAADFQREMRRRRITAMLAPTLVVHHVVREDRDAFAPLRVLQAGGDVLQPSVCRELLAGDFTGALFNLYGPAEATTACTVHQVTPQDAASDTIPIGRALDGVSVHVLDERMAPVPDGRVGEIYVGGGGVGRGYLDRPDLTEERFVPDPFGDGNGRLYRTGDRARRREDGVLEYAGRLDGQVKIRGYRVEPGEVERALSRHPRVREAVVVAAGEGGDRRLVAFTVPDGDLLIRDLRDYAEAQLPHFMAPSHYVVVPGIPGNDNGKRDIGSLLGLLREHEQRHERFVPPATDSERYLAGLWEGMLAVERIGAGDDFFELGGHSLMAFRVQSRVKRDLGVALGQKVVLRNSVLSDLAAAIDEAREGEDPV